MMIPKHSKVTVPESHRPTKNSVRAGERPEDCRAVGSVLSERFYSRMEPKPVDYLATAHPASNRRAHRDDLINYARHATIQPAHRVDIDQKLP